MFLCPSIGPVTAVLLVYYPFSQFVSNFTITCRWACRLYSVEWPPSLFWPLELLVFCVVLCKKLICNKYDLISKVSNWCIYSSYEYVDFVMSFRAAFSTQASSFCLKTPPMLDHWKTVKITPLPWISKKNLVVFEKGKFHSPSKKQKSVHQYSINMMVLETFRQVEFNDRSIYIPCVYGFQKIWHIGYFNSFGYIHKIIIHFCSQTLSLSHSHIHSLPKSVLLQ